VRLGSGLGIVEILAPHRDALFRSARRFGVKRLRVFGSVRRREARPDSDVDFLVEWKRTRPPVAFLDLPLALEDILGRSVDVVTPEMLHWSIRPKVEAEAVPF
jgi:predicted nucleotidyltransferase